jgi:hypothetical protein
MFRRVTLVRTDFSEELSASFIRMTRIGELGRTLAVTSNRRSLWINAIRRHSSHSLPWKPQILHSHLLVDEWMNEWIVGLIVTNGTITVQTRNCVCDVCITQEALHESIPTGCTVEQQGDSCSHTPATMHVGTFLNYEQELQQGRAFVILTVHYNGGSGCYVAGTASLCCAVLSLQPASWLH